MKSSVYQEIINIKCLGRIDLPDVKSYFKVTVIKAACWAWPAFTVWHSQMSELSVATGSLEDDWPRVAETQDSVCRGNFQTEAEGRSFAANHGGVASVKKIQPEVPCQESLREPQKHSARQRLSIGVSATSRRHRHQIKTVLLFPALHPCIPGGA